MTGDRSGPDFVVRGLAARALDAYRQGLTGAPPIETDIDAHFNAKYLLGMARSLTLPEISCLLEASRAREEGLRLAREGDIAQAGASMARARELLDSDFLSEEAVTVGRSFQLAADAFLDFRQDDPLAARRALLEALSLCGDLADRYGYDIEVRRVHLARNAVRVEAAAGNSQTALRMALDLASYLDGDRAAWPFPELAAKSSPLGSDEKRALMGQVWTELSRLLTDRPVAASPLWNDPKLTAFGPGEGGASRQLTAWLEATRALQGEDIPTFLRKAVKFFAEGPVIENAWRDFTQVFAAVAERLLGPGALQAPPYSSSTTPSAR
jgi:hypothetical protein